MKTSNSESRQQRRSGILRVRPVAFGIRGDRLGSVRAFTLTELLVVMVIIGIMASVALPRMPGIAKSHSMIVATRQLLDDVAYARQKAINDHTTVYMVFVPPDFWVGVSGWSQGSRMQATNLVFGQYASYALYSPRSIGDQPGQAFPRYLTDWRDLPDGVIIDTNKFLATTTERMTDPYDPTYKADVRPFAKNLDFVFPAAELTNGAPVKVKLPYIGFDSQGKLVSGQDEYLPLVRGSILHPRTAGSDLPAFAQADVQQPGYREPNRTNYNLIHIDWLTGRAKVEKLGEKAF